MHTNTQKFLSILNVEKWRLALCFWKIRKGSSQFFVIFAKASCLCLTLGIVGSLKCWQRFYILNWGKIAGLWGTLLLMTGWAISFNSTHWFKGEWQLHCQTWQYNHCQPLLQASFYEFSVLHFEQLSSFFFWSGKKICIRLSNLKCLFFKLNIV